MQLLLIRLFYLKFWFKQILADKIPLVDPFCQDDINLIALYWSWMENST
jgi:hypothetical protein